MKLDNTLFCGDNLEILTEHITEELIGLIYIDPPFDVGEDFSMDIEIGDNSFTKKPNILEEIAYRDTWGEVQTLSSP